MYIIGIGQGAGSGENEALAIVQKRVKRGGENC